MRSPDRLKLIMTPIWTREMGQRLRIARMKQRRTQRELAAILTTEGRAVSQQQVAWVEQGRLDRLKVNWARLEAVLGQLTGYVLTAKDHALYDENEIALRYFVYRQQTMRARGGKDPKLGEIPPHGPAYSRDYLVQIGRDRPRKRGSTR